MTRFFADDNDDLRAASARRECVSTYRYDLPYLRNVRYSPILEYARHYRAIKLRGKAVEFKAASEEKNYDRKRTSRFFGETWISRSFRGSAKITLKNFKDYLFAALTHNFYFYAKLHPSNMQACTFYFKYSLIYSLQIQKFAKGRKLTG